MNTQEKYSLQRENAVLLIVDIQEKLCRVMDPERLEKLTGNVSILLEAAASLRLPVLGTEQYPAGLGKTLPALTEKMLFPVIEKMSFSCCGDPAFLERLRNLKRKQVIITGMEAHICVLQTVLDLLDNGFYVQVVSDGVISRKPENLQIGLAIAASAGAVITSTETVLFQLLKVAGTDEFKKLSKLVR